MRTFWLGACLALVTLSCSKMAKIESLRDDLADDDAAALKEDGARYPLCTKTEAKPESPRECFGEIATALGSKSGFKSTELNQAAAATVAVVIVRDGHAEWFSSPDVWMASVATGKGPGADSLRLAVARQMAMGAGDVGRVVNEEKDALPLLRAIGQSIPGACSTYAAMGEGTAIAALPIASRPDHAPCVQKDLGRKDGPGGTYGRDTWRATEGALALWKDEARALRDGLAVMAGKPKATLEAKLALIDAATAKAALKKVPREDAAYIEDMADKHGDAGVLIRTTADAGGDAATLAPSHPATLKPN